jgi:hypothetical protein
MAEFHAKLSPSALNMRHFVEILGSRGACASGSEYVSGWKGGSQPRALAASSPADVTPVWSNPSRELQTS